MPQILPFKGILYNPNKINIQSAVAPPYDIISGSMQEQLYNASPYNIVRLTLGKIFSDDSEKSNRYTRAKNFFSEWQKNRILIQDKNPAIYVYEQEFEFKGEAKKLTGFIAICKLEDFSQRNIRPHEMTFKGPIKDRFMLMKACMANFEPIYCLYTNGNITKLITSAKREPIFDFNEGSSKRHRLLRITDNLTLSKLPEEMSKDVIYIADGHHRYQTALEFSKVMHRISNETKTMPYDYVMMFLADINDGSVIILPTHRVISKFNIGLKKFITRAEKFFSITKIEDNNNLNLLLAELERNKTTHAIGALTANESYMLILKDNALAIEYGINRYNEEGKSVQWSLLDVSIFDNLIIKNILNMERLSFHQSVTGGKTNLEKIRGGTELTKSVRMSPVSDWWCPSSYFDNYDDKDILYTRDANEALRLAGESGMAFLLNPHSIEEIKEIADINETMPHKSTYFFPKPLSGLAISNFSFI